MQRQTLCLDKHPTEIHMVSSAASLKSHTEKQRLIKCGRASLTTGVSTYHNFVTLLRNEHIHISGIHQKCDVLPLFAALPLYKQSILKAPSCHYMLIPSQSYPSSHALVCMCQFVTVNVWIQLFHKNILHHVSKGAWLFNY